MKSRTEPYTGDGDLADLFVESCIPPLTCWACTGFLEGLRHPCEDGSGQRHFTEADALAVGLPALRSSWIREASEESCVYSRRSEGEILRSLRGERSYCRALYVPGAGETGGPRIVEMGEYVVELDGDPFDAY